MADGADAVQDRDQPAHADAALDPVMTQAERTQLAVPDDPALPLGERHHVSLHTFWAG
jgi:hypothetical protein